MTKNYILAVLQQASDGADIARKKFDSVKTASDWIKTNCKPTQINGTIFEMNGLYDFSVGFVEYSSKGEPITRSFQNDCVLLYKDQANL